MNVIPEVVQDACSALLRIGCSRRRFSNPHWVPACLPDRILFQATPTSPVRQSHEDIWETTKEYTRLCVVLEVGVVDPAASKGLVLDYYLPPAISKAPVIVILPLLNDNKYLMERYFAGYFVEHGFAAIIIQRQQKYELIAKAEDINLLLQQSVLNSRSVLDWIQARRELYPDRIAVLGVSMGGITGVPLVAIDERIKAAVLGLVAGDLPYILRNCEDRGISRKRDEYLKQHTMPPEVFERELRRILGWEPLDFAEFIDPAKVLSIQTIYDHVVRPIKQQQLWRAMGEPARFRLRVGHYPAIAFLPLLRRVTLKFYKQKLDVL